MKVYGLGFMDVKNPRSFWWARIEWLGLWDAVLPAEGLVEFGADDDEAVVVDR